MPTLSPRHVFLAAAVLLAVGAVAAGLAYSGSPATERARRLDDERSSHLEQIANAVSTYALRNGDVPESLDQLAADATAMGSDPRYWLPSVTDPVTKEPYEYRRLTDLTYELCATFQTARTSDGDYDLKTSYRSHEAGRRCWTVSPASSLSFCDNREPCPVGQQCLSFPEKRAACVPTGRECAWAGCPGACDLLKSNPPRVTCRADEGGAVLNPPTKADDAAGCRLMKNAKTSEVNCFGCTSGQEQNVCTDPTGDWEAFAPTGDFGIPYACYASPTKGCQLAQ